jgi:hypothetical protein
VVVIAGIAAPHTFFCGPAAADQKLARRWLADHPPVSRGAVLQLRVVFVGEAALGAGHDLERVGPENGGFVWVYPQ